MKLLPIFPGRRSHFSLNFLASLNPDKFQFLMQTMWTLIRTQCLIWSTLFAKVLRSLALIDQMSHLVTKPTKWSVCLAKTQINLGTRQVWSKSSLCTQWVAKDPSFLHVDSEDSDQTVRMPRLIWVFAGRSCQFVGFVMRRLKCQGQGEEFP